MLFVERTSATFIATLRNGTPNMAAMEIATKGLAGVAFVCHQPLGSQAQVTCSSANGTSLHQFFSLVDVTFLTGCEQKGDQSACTFTTNVNFGAEPTTRAT